MMSLRMRPKDDEEPDAIMDPSQFQRIETLFNELVDLAEPERSNRLDALAISDPALVAHLRSLLARSVANASPLGALQDIASAVRDGTEDLLGEGSTVGAYQLQRKLGEGGMGSVFLAVPIGKTAPQVAIKLIRSGWITPELRSRFLSESSALAVLEHPNIARIIETGSTPDGRPWFAMEYVDGVPITQWAVERQMDLGERIQLLLPVCEAIQHAHRKGLIHRDIKPSNLLVRDDGAHGHPMVIDFGVAKLIERGELERSLITHMGELVGTPEYMSPEQATLGELDVDTRSDVYALGLVLYELLCGSLPVSSQALRRLAFLEMCRVIREQEITAPSRFSSAADSDTYRWRSALRGDLDAVVLKALAKDRERRYDSVNALAQDLRRFLAHQPVSAQPPSLRYVVGKFARRHRAGVAAAVLSVSALAIGTTLSLWGYLRAEQSLDRMNWSLGEAELRNDIANSYADALARLFGEEADATVLTAQLLRYAEESHADWQKDPENAALRAFAVGRHLLNRHDYVNAKAVFERWIHANYGREELRALGWQLLGFAYKYTNDNAAALAAFRQAAKLRHRYEMDTPGHASGLVQIALLSRDSVDAQAAEQAIERAVRTVSAGAQTMSLMNTLGQLRSSLGDYKGSLQAIQRAVAEIDAHPHAEISGRMINRLNYAWMSLKVRNDTATAIQQLQRVHEEEAVNEGRSLNTAFALEIEAILDRLQGKPEESAKKLGNAIDIAREFAGVSSPAFRRAELERLLSLHAAGDLDALKQHVDASEPAIEGAENPRRVIGRTLITLLARGPDAASTTFQEAGMDIDRLRQVAYLWFALEYLQAQGVMLSASAS